MNAVNTPARPRRKGKKMMMAIIKNALTGEVKAMALKFGLATIAMLFLLVGWASVKALKADLGRLEAINGQLITQAAEADKQLQAARAEAAGMARELERSYQALSDREAEKNRLAAEKEARQAEICEVNKNDQSANTWINDAVPANVAGRLCRPPSVPTPKTAAGGLPSRCAGASVKNGDLVNWIFDLQEALRQSNSDKAALREWVAAVLNPAEP